MASKFSWKKYYEPTPANIRRFADSALAACTFAGSYTTLYEGKPWVGMTIVAIGVLAKFASNFFTEIKEPPQQEENG